MEQIVALVEGSTYGYLVLAGLGFAEYVGIPIVSVPVDGDDDETTEVSR